MKKRPLIILLTCLFLGFGTFRASAQCSICTRTAQQLGERPAKALNAGIIYLAVAPLTIAGIIGYKWWRSNSTESA